MSDNKFPYKYAYKELGLIKPGFESNLLDLIIELDHLRKKELSGSTPIQTFLDLKSLFHIMESIGSARIEGNHTTIIDFIDSKIKKPKSKSEKIKEIQNVEDALRFIDEEAKQKTLEINEQFIKKLHKMVVKDLSPKDEGDEHPGEYRKTPIGINNSSHTPPAPIEVDYYMDELFSFVERRDAQKYDLLKIALTHHRFVWIHPFGDGNGRTVRLITYAQLVYAGFNVQKVGRVINPTAIFCSNRDKYYDYLSKADTGTAEGLLEWCEYVLKGLATEIEKIDKLTDYSYLSQTILLPAIDYSLERKFITGTEADILRIAVKEKGFQAGDLKNVFPNKLPQHISRYISGMKQKKLILPEFGKSRKYLISFEPSDNYIIRGVIEMLSRNNFLPIKNDV